MSCGSLRRFGTLAFAAVLAFALTGTGDLLKAQTPPPPSSQVPPAPLLSPDQLDDLVAPIALYPDPLLSQVLVASTYPLEVVEAQQWIRQSGNLRGAELMDAARRQNMDPIVLAPRTV